MLKNILIGSDPEFLVFDDSIDRCYPGVEYTHGTKEDPESIGMGYFIQKDNALLEGNIPPARNKGEFIFYMEHLIAFLSELVSPSRRIIFSDSGEFNIESLDSPELKIFGCAPYNNVWSGEEVRASDLSDFNYRTCGFHIHIGYDLTSDKYTREEFNKFLVKAFDLFVILPSYLIHFDPKRSTAYGGLGNYRDKSYGVECRSLGGFFCNPELLEWVWDNTQKAIQFCQSEENLTFLQSLEKPTSLDREYIEKYLETLAIPV